MPGRPCRATPVICWRCIPTPARARTSRPVRASEQRDRAGSPTMSKIVAQACPRGRRGRRSPWQHQQHRQHDGDERRDERRDGGGAPRASSTPCDRRSPASATSSPAPAARPAAAENPLQSASTVDARRRRRRQHGRSMTAPSSGPATISVGIATMQPEERGSARGPPAAASIADRGPGCGGTSPCSTDRPASAGMPILISVDAGAPGDQDDDRDEDHHADLEEQRQPDDGGDQRHRPRQPLRADAADDPCRRSCRRHRSRRAACRASRRGRSAGRRSDGAAEPVGEAVSEASSGDPGDGGQAAVPRISARNGWNFSQLISTTMAAMPTRHARISCVPGLLTGSASGRGTEWSQRRLPVDMRPPGGGCRRWRES